MQHLILICTSQKSSCFKPHAFFPPVGLKRSFKPWRKVRHGWENPLWKTVLQSKCTFVFTQTSCQSFYRHSLTLLHSESLQHVQNNQYEEEKKKKKTVPCAWDHLHKSLWVCLWGYIIQHAWKLIHDNQSLLMLTHG